jgi:hypothetical protein
MKPITREDARRLSEDPISFAMMMDCYEIEQVIADFVSVLNKRKEKPR